MAEQMLPGARTMPLTADDPYFLDRIMLKKYEDYSQGYEKAKTEFATWSKGGMRDDFSIDEWEKRVSALIARYPDVPGLYYLRALYHSERQSGLLVRADLAKALELFPQFAEALVQQAEQLLEEYDLDGAIATTNQAIDANPDAAEAYVLRARTTFAKSPAARDAYEEDLAIARKLDPNDSSAIYFQRVLLRQLRGPRELGCRFEHTTDHYFVTSDVSAEASRRYGEALESVWSFYAESFKNVSRNPYMRKPRVAIFQTAENYYTYFELLSESRGEETLGVFRPQFNEFVLFDTADRDETMQVLFHEQFHQFMHLMTSETPPFWYNEGMAEYMSAVTLENGKVAKTAQMLQGRLLYAKLMVDVDHVIPFEKIMCETPREFLAEAGLTYAQSWSMIHFFYEYSGRKYRPLIERYFKEIRARTPPRQAYESVFKEKAADLEKEWREYVKNLKP
jgi:tetratricopeptide (TPR) repeat protein